MDAPSFPGQPGNSSNNQPVIRAPSSSPEAESAPAPPGRSPSTEDPDVDIEDDGDYKPNKPSKRAKTSKKDTGGASGSGERVFGTSLFPLARVQKILKADKDMPPCSKEAVFLIATATEEFVKRLVLAGHGVMRRDNRMMMQHKDLAAAVRRHDELGFLDDIIPETISASTALARREALLAKAKEAEASKPEKGSTAIEKAFERGTKKATKGKGKGKANASSVDEGTDGTDGHLTPAVAGSRNTSTSTSLAAKVESMAVADDEDADMEDA